MSILIKDTTRQEREQIVADALGAVDTMCDECPAGMMDMYQAYINGEMELREINAAFRRGMIVAGDRNESRSCTQEY